MDYNAYALRRDAATVSKFITRIVKHREDLAIYQMNPSTAKFPRPLGKDAKWPAYEAAGRIVRELNLNIYVQSVSDMTLVLAEAMKVI